MNDYETLKRNWKLGYSEDWQFIDAAWLQHREDDARREVAKVSGTMKSED